MTPDKDRDSLGTIARAVRFPITLSEKIQMLADDRDLSFSYVIRQAALEFLDRQDHNSATLDRPDEAPVVEVTGPWGGKGTYRLMVDGIQVPYIEISKREAPAGTYVEDAPDGAVYILALDNRFQTKELTWGELWTQAWFWAQAMAISAGYSSHGQNSLRINRHGPNERMERGWEIMADAGMSGHTYEIGVTFLLPGVYGADQDAYALRDALIRTATEHGARDVVTRLISMTGMEMEGGTTVTVED